MMVEVALSARGCQRSRGRSPAPRRIEETKPDKFSFLCRANPIPTYHFAQEFWNRTLQGSICGARRLSVLVDRGQVISLQVIVEREFRDESRNIVLIKTGTSFLQYVGIHEIPPLRITTME